MALLRLRLFYLLTLTLMLAPVVRASDFPPITDEEMKFKEVPGQPGAAAAVLYREEIDDDARTHSHSTYERIKILTEAGRKYADVEIPFDRSFANVESVTGRTIHADGTIVPFNGKVYDKEIAKGRDFKVHVKSFTMPDVQVGSIIEYRYYYRYADNSFIAPYWHIQGPLWIKKAHYRFYPVPFHTELILQHGLIGNGVSWVSYLPKTAAAPHQVTLPTGEYYVDLDIDSMPPFIDEPYMPDNGQFLCHVRFFYRVPQIKNGEFWKTEGKFWNKDIEKFIGKKDGINDALAKLVAPNDTPEQKVKKIYAFIGTFENQSFRPERSALEMKALGMKEVRGASDVLQQKSGTREDLTRLFVAMVRAAGIPAYVMDVTSRESRFFVEDYLSPDQLDAEIAVVQLNGKDVFLDPGTKYCPYGLLDWRHTSTRGLRQTDGGAVLAETPVPEYKDAITERIGRFAMNENGSLEGTLEVGYFGQRALSRRDAAIRKDAEGRKKMLEDEVRDWLPSGADVKLISDPQWDTSEGPVIAKFHVVTSAASNAGRHALLPALLCELNERPKFTASNRVNGIYLYYPWGEVDIMSVTLPTGFEVESLPQSETASVGYGVYKTKWTQDKQTITVRRDLAVGGFVFPASHYSELKGFFDKVKTGDEQQAVLKVNGNALGK